MPDSARVPLGHILRHAQPGQPSHDPSQRAAGAGAGQGRQHRPSRRERIQPRDGYGLNGNNQAKAAPITAPAAAANAAPSRAFVCFS